jgi:hypothetical protein
MPQYRKTWEDRIGLLIGLLTTIGVVAYALFNILTK